jgi:hypothetical protein
MDCTELVAEIVAFEKAGATGAAEATPGVATAAVATTTAAAASNFRQVMAASYGS